MRTEFFTPRRAAVVLLLSFVVTPLSTVIASNPDHVAQLREKRSCNSCDLTGANFAAEDLQGVDVSDSNLKGASLSQANLYRAVLRNADLTEVSLVGTNLSGANLEGARGANLTGAMTDERTTCPGGTAGPCN